MSRIDTAPLTVAALCAAALVAFAANSILCRLALGAGAIDAASYTGVRLLSGALVLALIVRLRGARAAGATTLGWLPAAMLFAYAIAFSYAYLRLGAGTGALILFATVQLTMIGAGLKRGERLRAMQWIGLGLAVAGFVALVAPGLSAPEPFGAVLMTVAGVAWGVYSLCGRGAADPLRDTAGNFVRSVPLALLAVALAGSTLHAHARGVVLAVLSGAVTSGLGYVVWYAVLPRLSRAAAGIAQLAVPPLAALGGALLLSEQVGWRLVACSVAILGGVAVAVFVPARRAA